MIGATTAQSDFRCDNGGRIPPILEITDAGIGYGGKDIISGLSARFEKGGLTCVIGPNGSGKSTLLRALAGIARHSGTIALDGEDISRLPGRARARRVAYMPQTRPVPLMSVREMLENARFPYHGYSSAEKDAEAIEQAADMAGIGAFMDRRVSELSGGERQRAYFAMLLAQNAEVMLLDEPAAHLDLPYQLELMRTLDVLRRSGKTIIMAEHDLPRAFTYATDIKLLVRGCITLEGAPRDICKARELRAAFGAVLAPGADDECIYKYSLVRGEN